MEIYWGNLKILLERIISKSRKPDYITHAESTLSWLLKLEPESTQEMQISAFAHDIERCWFEKMIEVENESYINFKIRHSQRGADIISGMMICLDFTLASVKKVHYLISNHEIGGDREADLIRDADSLSFFEDNLPEYYKKAGKEETQRKITFMYNRNSDKAKKLVTTINFNQELKDLMIETLNLVF